MSFEKHVEMAHLAFKSEKFEEALQFYDKALALNENNADVVSEKGVTLFHLNRLEESLNCMNEAQIQEPQNPYRYSSRAFIKDALGKTDEAIVDYEKCIALDPDDAVAYNNLGLLQEKLGRMQKATKNFSKADELSAILEANNIDSSEPKPEPKFVNVQKEIDQAQHEQENKSKFDVIKEVFINKGTRKEFISFVKSGFKTKK